MTKNKNNITEPESEPVEPSDNSPERPAGATSDVVPSRWYWIRMLVQPVVAIAAIVLLVTLFGVVQRWGYFVDATGEATAAADPNKVYICPMFCVPPAAQPGRCPVCGMKLQEVEVTGDGKDVYGLTIDAASRRLAHIQTVVAATIPLTKRIRALGQISEDETAQATISAWVDGRLESMRVDFSGAEVQQGQELAVLYSPDMYSAQVELLESRKALKSSDTGNQRIADMNRRMYESARQRLIEFGMPVDQIEQLEQQGEASNRIRIVAPVTGTVTEKLAVEGEYLKTGMPIFRVVDLSQVWLMLELFPSDASQIRYGQQVAVTLQSQPGREFQGRVAFVSPDIDPRTRTVSIRVVIPNDSGLIRIGELAEAVVHVNVTPAGTVVDEVFDPQLAGKWISPRHPWIVRDEPGQCPECGEDLVPAEELGFVTWQPREQGSVVVPRSAVLIAGDESVAYVETEPGRFEFRRLRIGPLIGDQIAIVSGIEPGEHVVSNAAYRIDAAFNMAEKPSLIDPLRATRRDETGDESEAEQLTQIRESLTWLSDSDRRQAETQEICPVTEFALGSMGPPVKLTVAGRNLFICCEGCRERLVADPNSYFELLDRRIDDGLTQEQRAEIDAALANLSDDDRQLAEAQVFCPVADQRLGSMGTPIRVDVDGQPVFICCDGCRSRLLEDPAPFVAKLKSGNDSGQQD